MIRKPAILVLLAVALAACSSTTTTPSRFVFGFDFDADTLGWSAGFSDYPVGREADVQFTADHRPLPDSLSGSAFYHHGTNISDDLFMYFDRVVTGLAPDGEYRVSFGLAFASNYGQDCDIGVGASVFLKAGAAGMEPEGSPDSTGIVRLNIDKGNQANGGVNAVLLGDVRNGRPGCAADAPFAIAGREGGDTTILVRADGTGRIWLFFGSESAFESEHELYFTRLRAVLEATGADQP
jgi:hypothetical protein